METKTYPDTLEQENPVGMGLNTPRTRVVNIHKVGGVVPEYDVYIGRGLRWHVDERVRKRSVFYNPFKMGKDGTREEVLKKYIDYLLCKPELVKLMIEVLPGKVLGCWCLPEHCHGEIIAAIVNEQKTLPELKDFISSSDAK